MAFTETQSATVDDVRPDVAEVICCIDGLQPRLQAFDVNRCGSEALRQLTDGIRRGQRALDSLLIRAGMAADQLSAKDRSAADARDIAVGRGQVRGATARREAARASVAAEMSRVRDAVEQGRLGGEQMDSIARAANDLLPEQVAELNNEAMIEAAESLPADIFARYVRREAQRISGDHGLADTKAKRAASKWTHWVDRETGMGKISAQFDPERYEAIVNAVEHHVSRLANSGGVAKNNNLAAAAAFELMTGRSTSTPGVPHINVVVDQQTWAAGPHKDSLCETDRGSTLAPESLSRLACDATVRRVVVDKREVPINVGRKHRTATDGQWQALRAVYRTCAWPNCDLPLGWSQAHHIHEWDNDGPTDLRNLVPLCNRHHHAVHEGGWSVILHSDRRLAVHTPDGQYDSSAYPDRIRSDRLPIRPGAP